MISPPEYRHRSRVVAIGSCGSGKTKFLQYLLALNERASDLATSHLSKWSSYPATVETRHLSCCELNIHLVRKNASKMRNKYLVRGIIQDELLCDSRYIRAVEHWKNHVTQSREDQSVSQKSRISCPCERRYRSGVSHHTFRENEHSTTAFMEKEESDDEDTASGAVSGRTHRNNEETTEETLLMRTLVGYEIYDTSGGVCSHQNGRRAKYLAIAEVLIAVYDSHDSDSVATVLRLLGEYSKINDSLTRDREKNGGVASRSGNGTTTKKDKLRYVPVVKTLGRPPAPIRTKSLIIVEMHHGASCTDSNRDRYFHANEVRSLRYYYKDIVALNENTSDWCALSKRYNNARNCRGIHRFFVRCHPCDWTTSREAGARAHVFLQRVLGLAMEPIVRNRYFLPFPELRRLDGTQLNNNDEDGKDNDGCGDDMTYETTAATNAKSRFSAQNDRERQNAESLDLASIDNSINEIIVADRDDERIAADDADKVENERTTTEHKM